MPVEPLGISMMHARIAIAAVALTHSLFATFIVGASVLAVVTATAAYITRRPWYGRLAHMIAFTLVLSTATISFLGVMLVFFLNIYWPRFWHTIFRIMFWPFLLEALLFLGEAVFVYAWYYLWHWSSVEARRGLHLALIWLGAGCAVAAMFMIDLTASYMLTPHPATEAWANVFNPTMIHLHLHRWFGNFAWAGFALAALCAIGLRRATDPQDRHHYRRAAAFCFAIGFGALLVMPVIGYQYLLNLRYGQPQAFQVLMLGERSWLFAVIALLYGLLVVTGTGYIASVVNSRAPTQSAGPTFVSWSLVILGAAAAMFAVPYHVQHVPFASHLTELAINPLGKMQPYKYLAIAFLIVFGLANLLYFLRWLPVHVADRLEDRAARDRHEATLLLSLAVITVFMMLGMGWVRETARASDGYLIYGHMTFSDERPTFAPPAP